MPFILKANISKAARRRGGRQNSIYMLIRKLLLEKIYLDKNNCIVAREEGGGVNAGSLNDTVGCVRLFTSQDVSYL